MEVQESQYGSEVKVDGGENDLNDFKFIPNEDLNLEDDSNDDENEYPFATTGIVHDNIVYDEKERKLRISRLQFLIDKCQSKLKRLQNELMHLVRQELEENRSSPYFVNVKEEKIDIDEENFSYSGPPSIEGDYEESKDLEALRLSEIDMEACVKCNKKFQTSKLSKHVLRCRGGRKPAIPLSQTCEVCGKICRSRKAYRAHKVCHLPAEAKQFVCTICGKSFLRQHELYRHNLTHTGERKFSCHICSRPFIQKSHLLSHVARHARDSELAPNAERHRRTYTCGICGQIYQHKSEMDAHREAEHDSSELFNCEVCGKSLNTQATLAFHMLIHQEGSFQCDQCPKTFTAIKKLNIHTSLYHSGKEYLCPDCGKSYSTNMSFKHHMNTHGERKYSCDLCDRKFRHFGNLTSHKRWHTGRKDYVCQICARAFARPHALKNHHKIHVKQNFVVCEKV